MLHSAPAAAALGLVMALVAATPSPAKPAQTTRYTYYAISGQTPTAIYTSLLRNGPKVDGAQAYAATTAVSSQSGKMRQGTTCEISGYRLNIAFTIKLPRLKDEARLTGETRSRWLDFSAYLRRHEETHRSIWLDCAAGLEARIEALKGKSCADIARISKQVWEQSRKACTKRHDAFDAQEQRAILKQPFVRLVIASAASSTHALKVAKK